MWIKVHGERIDVFGFADDAALIAESIKIRRGILKLGRDNVEKL